MPTSPNENDNPLTGVQMMDQIAEHPSIDELLRRNPHAKPLSDADVLAMIEHRRRQRALFNMKDERRRAKKEGIELKEEPTDGEDSPIESE